MTVVRFDPFRELDRWAQQAWAPAGRGRVRTMPFDAVRHDHDVVLHFDLPGVDPESIEVTVEKGSLTVAAERPSVREEGDEVLVAERPTGRLVRQLLLSEGLDTDAVSADYHDGVLTVTVPAAAEVRPRKVAIHTGTQPAVETTATEGGEHQAA